MTRLVHHPLAGIAASALLLTAILAYLVLDRIHLITSGREISLPIKPVDPRDIFKGDYARLGYDISRPPQALMAPVFDKSRRGTDVFVTIESSGGTPWHVVAVSALRPRDVGANQLVLAGRLAHSWQNTINYGIERYFVPEGEGRKLEDLARTSQLSAVIAVDARGRAAIKGIEQDGKRIYDEPLL